jgi:FixJ family two-component response regulator
MTEYKSQKPEILVIDDDESICETLEVIIHSLGYYCVYFTSPDRGLEYFQRETNPLVLLDVNLPNVSGLDILAKFKDINPMTQVLMMTGEREIQTVVTSLYNKATDFLLKPFTLDTVKHAISRALGYYDILKEKESTDESIIRDLRLASKIQSKLFTIPNNLKHNIVAEVNPAMYVSGDYYQVINLTDSKILVLLGDIEDHGVTSGLIGLLMNSLVKEIARTGELNPSEYLKKMNLELCNEIGTHSMTGVILIIDSDKKEITYSRGGHPFPIVYPANQSEYKLLSERSGHLLGIMQDIEFQTNRLSYMEGDIIFLYSDGLVNSLQSPILESLNSIHLNSSNRLGEMVESLKDYSISLRENSPFQDDISYLLVELK